MSDIARVLEFWFAPGQAAKWWVRDPAFDAEIRRRFATLHDAAAAGALEHWRATAHGALALVILLDQFSRNLFRDDPRAYASDAHALGVALAALDRGFDRGLDDDRRSFLYMPLQHAEDLPVQERCCALFATIADAESIEAAAEHRATIARFGRFPMRNAALGRQSTPEERRFLTERSYDAVAEEYARRIYGELEHKPFDRALLDRVAMRLEGRGPVWDLGCGPGHVTRYLHDRGVAIVGLDLSRAMVEQARALNPAIAFRQGDLAALEAEAGSLAGIIAFYSLIHLPSTVLGAVLAGFRRALRPGGLLLVAVHAGEGHIHLDQWWQRTVSIDTHFFAGDALARLATAAGFVVEELIEREPYPEVEYPSRRAYLLARA
jgi:uncharacterized protein (DUF924 family)/SAM-dependent methyltransferase